MSFRRRPVHAPLMSLVPTPAFVISIYAQIGDIKPITKSVRAKQNAYDFSSSLRAARLMEAF